MPHYVLDARTATIHFPGIGRYAYNLAKAMTALINPDEQLTILYHSNEPSLWDLTQLSGGQTPVEAVPISPFSLQQQWRIPQLLRQLQADIYHSTYFLMPYWFKVTTLVTLYDTIPFRYPGYFTPLQRIIIALTVRLAVRSAQAGLTISSATAQDLSAHFSFDRKPLEVIPLAADTDFQPASQEQIDQIKSRLNLPQSYVLYLGSNKPHKNLVRLVEAWGKLKPPSTTLVIAGVWDTRYPQTKTEATRLDLEDSIQFIGPIADKDVAALYSGASFFVFPSEYEGFGLPVLEAMACGAAVACSNSSSLPEIAGEAALMFDPYDIDAIAHVLDQMLTNSTLRTELQEKSLQQASLFTWEKTAQATLNLYRQYVK